MSKPKIQKSIERKDDMTDLLAKHPNGIYLSGALLMFAGSKSYYLYGAHRMITVTSCLTIICNMR